MELFNLKDHSEKVSFSQAVVKGIGRDQGLFFPDHIEPLANIAELLDMPLAERSAKILRHLIGDEIPTLEAIVKDAFTFKAPIVKADENIYALELFHGPTLAFKDFGARFMARVLSAVKGDKDLTILTATSGDTGAAVAAAFYEQKGINVVVLYPKGKISELQEKLIATLGKNIKAVQVEGIFDQCQDMVKTAFDDAEFKERIGLNSANSINISRLLAQVSYYFEAVAQLPKEKREKVVFSVPCGNFGNITAGLIAKALGLKARFVISCNANDTVPRYLKSGNWEPHKTVATLSNAMDISRPNNWPRVEALVKMQGWKLSDFDFGSMSDEQTEKTMQTLYKKTGYIAEPHAAIAYQILADNLKEGETGIFLGTAHPAKFKSDVDRILNIDVPLPKALADKVSAESKSVVLKPDYETLKSYVLEALNK
ncbi:threonine synthase [Succinivibrio dextrinosolvens DSM 3072]|uniref:Threonine synthase n=1 Tax=Succinivibrio dextrinosolvens DSM 3072 TaxID=1123324 RepID=A0A1T4VKV7_9GAMM|nr:threonine synthase [Succinivibrio dextrinosolvens]SKA65602.1 threonine synthase [Succinivibrio dextrinosolvens DSM 3072]